MTFGIALMYLFWVKNWIDSNQPCHALSWDILSCSATVVVQQAIKILLYFQVGCNILISFISRCTHGAVLSYLGTGAMTLLIHPLKKSAWLKVRKTIKKNILSIIKVLTPYSDNLKQRCFEVFQSVLCQIVQLRLMFPIRNSNSYIS